MRPPITATLAELRRQFASQLSVRLETIRRHFDSMNPAAWHADDLEVLHRQVHGLTGSAGTFGMQPISDSARILERRLSAVAESGEAPPETEWQSIGQLLDDLEKLAKIPPDSMAPSLQPPEAPQRLAGSSLIYLVEDDPLQAEQLSLALREEDYRVEIFADAAQFRAACSAPETERPAAVLMDMILPEGDAVGAELITELGLGQGSDIPVVVISVRDDLAARLAAMRAGACRYLAKPVVTSHLIDLLDGLTGRQPAEPYRVLLVDDDPLLLDVQAAVLRQAGMVVNTVSKPLRTIEMVAGFDPDVVVLDVYMPDASGPELAAVLREQDAYLQLPILFLSAETDMTAQLLALNLGGDDFLVKPVRPNHLVASVTARARRSRQNKLVQRRLVSTLYEREREHLTLNHHAIVSIADRTGAITYVNDRFCRISGYSSNELIGQNHRIVKSDYHTPAFYKDLWSTIGRGDIWQGEICNRRKDGSLYWVASTITPFIDGQGVPYQYVSIRTDISHVKAAEAALRHSEARLSFLVSSSPVVIYTCEVKPPYAATYVSPNVHQLMGFDPEQFTGHADFWADNIHPDDRQRVLDKLASVWNDGVHKHEYRFRMNDGSYRWVHDELLLVRDAAGQPQEIIGYWLDITERKLAEDAARRNKDRLSRGQIFANIGTWDWHIQTGELYWSERIGPLFGYAEGELETSYENFINAIHPDDRQAVSDAVNACVERDVPYDIEHRVVWPDGTVRWLLERGAVQRDDAGRPVQMLGIVQDIDDRKRAELALAEREYQLREAQTLARIGNWQADLQSGDLVWSDEIYRIFGHQPGSIEPSVEIFRAAVHPDDLALLEAAERVAEQTGRHDVVHRIVRPDGTIRHVHELAQAETDADGLLVKLSGTVQDITERVEAEARLRETEERFTFAVEGAGDGVWDWDMRTNAMQFSRLYMAMLGYTENELPHHADTWVDSVHPDDLARVQDELQGYLSGRLPAYAVELRLRCKDGSYKWILCRGTVVSRDSKGAPTRMIGIHSDITDRKKSEQALIDAREEADRANKAKSEFLSSMSHELRTPMNAILGFGQLMEYDRSLPEDQRDNVSEILKAGHHLLELINEVLDLAKVESGYIDLSLEQVEVCPIVEECMSLVGTIADRHGIHIGHTGLQGIAVRADRTRLKQVLINLLTNAIKYNREGGTVSVDVQLQDSGRLRIRVIDTGRGIPTKRLGELFQPFNRLDAEHSDIEGTGIGLTISRRIVEMMGGSLDVESKIDVGSTFWVELPLEDTPFANQGAVTDGVVSEHALSALRNSSEQHLVLYIEDNPVNLRLVAQLLGLRKHINLHTAHTPELGIELALARRPELILLDINMPGMDGYQVLEIIKADASLRSIPVVAISANAMPRDIERGIAAGFCDYLTKPIDVGRFFDMLDRNLLGQMEVSQ